MVQSFLLLLTKMIPLHSKQANNKSNSPPFVRLLGKRGCLKSKCTVTHAKLNHLDITCDLSAGTVISECRKERLSSIPVTQYLPSSSPQCLVTGQVLRGDKVTWMSLQTCSSLCTSVKDPTSHGHRESSCSGG